MKDKKIESLWSNAHSLVILGATGSFTAAAERLGVSKAAISLRIAELERAAGVPLVQRTTRSVRLTEAGQHLVDSTRGAFANIERQFASVRDMASRPSGVLLVTAPVALGRQQIVPRMPSFLREYPDVRVELDLFDRISALPREGFDLAIRHTDNAPDTHVAWNLCRTESVLVATRAYLRRNGVPRAPGDLANHPCLHYLRRSETPVWTFEPSSAQRGEARVNVAVSGHFSANNSEALREAALGGLGIALLPDFSAQADVTAGRLVTILTGWRPVGAFGNRIIALRPYSPYVPRAVRAYVEYLRQTLHDGFGTYHEPAPPLD
ncbi:hypothetical protein DFQ28_004530 [Apophysomyces sp. BC1034]|nr:hypothetical protein DFQ28_004530 [Apophysomyces sp. BC1034]